MRLSFVAVILLCLPVFRLTAQDTKYISFTQEKIAYAPKEFYINDVADDRADKKTDAVVNKGGGKHDKMMFTNGLASALKGFIEKNVSENKTTQAVVLHIANVDVNIKKDGKLWQVDAAVTLAFYAAGKKVVEYSGHSQGQTDKDPGAYLEKFMRQSVENDLKKFDTWWPQNRAKIPTNPMVKVNVTVSKTTDKPNCIAYSAQRQLQIADFTGPVEGQEVELAAATLSGIGVYYVGQPQNGQIVLNVTITPYFDRGRSWFKEKGKNPRVLAHEQTHFDITAIKACELANTIRNTAFTQENYEKVLNELQQQNAKASNDEESKYDSETNHGIIEDKQIMWQNTIKEQVRSVGCY